MTPDSSSSVRLHRVAVLAPMPSELRPLVMVLGLTRSAEREGKEQPDETRPRSTKRAELFWGTSGQSEVVATLTGVGMNAGAKSAERILDATAPDHLVVVGIAGGIGPSVAVGDVVVPERVLDLRTGESVRPVAMGELPQRGTLASSDTLLEAPEEAARLAAQGIIAIDMETAAIGAVCNERGCPWSVFRAVSDRADDGTTDAAVLGLIGTDGRPDLPAVARFVLTRPHRIPQLVRLGRGASAATRAAAQAAATALAGPRGA